MGGSLIPISVCTPKCIVVRREIDIGEVSHISFIRQSPFAARDGFYRFPQFKSRTFEIGSQVSEPEWLACRLAMVRLGRLYWSNNNTHGDVAELADALDLGSSSFTGVQVRFLSSPL